jgi:hypothetical protein
MKKIKRQKAKVKREKAKTKKSKKAKMRNKRNGEAAVAADGGRLTADG